MFCMCERKRVRERKNERRGRGQKSEIRKSERQSQERKTDRDKAREWKREKLGVAAQEAASDYSEGFLLLCL